MCNYFYLREHQAWKITIFTLQTYIRIIFHIQTHVKIIFHTENSEQKFTAITIHFWSFTVVFGTLALVHTDPNTADTLMYSWNTGYKIKVQLTCHIPDYLHHIVDLYVFPNLCHVCKL